jgi:hypothetical protein
MQIVQFAWIHVINGKIFQVQQPYDDPALMEIKRGDDFQNALRNLEVSEWRLSPGQTILQAGETQIEIQRDAEYDHPTGEFIVVPVDGEGTVAERVKRIQHRFEVNGYDFIQVFKSMNRDFEMHFRKRTGAPDVQPFVEPNLKDD